VTQAESEGVPQRAVARLRAHSERNFSAPFVVALTLGFITIGTMPPTWRWGPVLVMIAYFAWGLRTAKRAGLVVEFSDSFYYLGFALTLTSLLNATGVFGGELPDGKEMVIEFGRGLTTTVVGVVGRVVFQLYYQVAQEAIEKTTAQIQEVASRFVTALKETEEDLQRHAAVMRDAIKDIEKYLPETATAFGKMAGEIDAEARSVQQVLQEVSAQLGKADLPGTAAKLAISLQASGLRNELNNLEASLKSARSAMTAPKDDTPDASPSFLLALEQLARNMAVLQDQIRRLSGEVGQVSSEVIQLKGVLPEIVEAMKVQLRRVR